MGFEIFFLRELVLWKRALGKTTEGCCRSSVVIQRRVDGPRRLASQAHEIVSVPIRGHPRDRGCERRHPSGDKAMLRTAFKWPRSGLINSPFGGIKQPCQTTVGGGSH